MIPEASPRRPISSSAYFPGGDCAYRPIVTETPLEGSAVETATASIEVLLLWGDNVLHVQHLSPPRNLYVADDSGPFDGETLGVPVPLASAGRWPLVQVQPDGAVSVSVPKEACLLTTTADAGDEPPVPNGMRAAAAGGMSVPLGARQSVRFKLGEFTFVVTSTNAMKSVERGLAAHFDAESVSYFGLTLLAASSLMAALAYFVPPLGLTDSDALDQDRLYMMQTFLAASAERNQDEALTGATETKPSEGGTGTRAQGESGAMGKTTSSAHNQRYAVEKRADVEPQLSRSQAIEEARTFGLIAMLSGDPNAPTAPWGRELASGVDELSANGNLWAATIGGADGHGGLELAGIGEGGGGRGEGIGLGTLGGLGHGAGTGTGFGIGPGGEGLSRGHLLPTHKTRGPVLRTAGPVTTSGRLPPEVIQRTLRQNYGRFRMCYERGLGRNPNLQGRVAVRFVIGQDGTVQSATNGNSDLPDSSVIACVVSQFYSLGFPKPEIGIVTVVYPLMFTPS